MGLKERRKKIMALMLAACVAGTSVVPVAASDVSVFSDGTDESNETANRTVNVKLVDEDTQEFIAGGDVFIGQTTTTMNVNDLINLLACGLPEGYEVCAPGDVWVGDDSVTIEIRKTVTTRYLKVLFETEDGENVGGGDILIDKNTTVMNINDLVSKYGELPGDYELCESGDIYVGNDSVTIKVRKPVTNKYVNVLFETEDGENVGGGDILIDKDTTVIHTSELADLIPIPGDYELCEVGDIYVGNDSVTIKVRKIVKNKYVKVLFETEDGENVGGGDILIDKDTTVIHTSELADLIPIPGDYELCEVGDIYVGNDSVTIKVRKIVKNKYVKVLFETEDGENVGGGDILIDKDTTVIHTSELADLIPIPGDYELCEVGDIYVGNDSVTIKVRKIVKTKDITIVYQNRKGNVIDNDVMTVDKDATYVNTGKLSAPKGYTIGIVGDITISKDNKVYITVDQNKKSVTVIFEESGKVISSKKLSVAATAKYLNMSRVTAPEGYQIVTTDSKLRISKNNTVTVEVKKLGKTIKVVYRLAKTNKIVATGEIVVDKKATSIKASEVPVPAGYKMVTTGSCSVRTKKIEIYVKK